MRCTDRRFSISDRNPPRTWYVPDRRGDGAGRATGRGPSAGERFPLLGSAIKLLLDAGAADGVFRKDVDADDVLISINGVALAAGEPSVREQAGRLLDLLLDGLRYQR